MTSNPVGREAVEDGVDKRDDLLRRLTALAGTAGEWPYLEQFKALAAEADSLLAPKGLTLGDIAAGDRFRFAMNDADEWLRLTGDPWAVNLRTGGPMSGWNLNVEVRRLPAPSAVDVAAVERECAKIVSSLSFLASTDRANVDAGWLRERIAAIRAALWVKA